MVNYEGVNSAIQCNENDKMKDIINRFLEKVKGETTIDLFYLYNGTKVNFELTFDEQANSMIKAEKR